MQDDITFFDSQGIIPSRDARTIEDYLKEANTYFAVIQAVRQNPDVLTRVYRREVTVMEASPDSKKNFEGSFLTAPLPAIALTESDYTRLSGLNRWQYAGEKSSGTITTLNYYNLPLVFPIINNDGKESADDLSRTILHESIHAFRIRLEEGYQDSMVRVMEACFKNVRYKFVEESIAYFTGSWNGQVADFNVGALKVAGFASFISVCNVSISIPILLAWSYFQPLIGISLSVGGAIPTIAVPFYYGCKTMRFFDRCNKEGLKPGYLFLRSNPNEFSTKQPITDQLAHSDNLRFQIMARRLRL